MLDDPSNYLKKFVEIEFFVRDGVSFTGRRAGRRYRTVRSVRNLHTSERRKTYRRQMKVLIVDVVGK